MKTPSSILANILHRPEFKKVNSGYCFDKFLSLLQPKFQKAIAFVYVKNVTLFVALSHPGFKMELGYNKAMLKTLYDMLRSNDPRCKELQAVVEVVIFNSNKISIVKKQEVVEDTVPHYYEGATGEFELKSEDDDLMQKFETIKKSIKRNIV
ncbi:MAG: hypothetical protein U9N49_01775 [Campylobacterota bacterium]|nr:hypothetical protein [Campylobacterota bacterium]